MGMEFRATLCSIAPGKSNVSKVVFQEFNIKYQSMIFVFDVNHEEAG